MKFLIYSVRRRKRSSGSRITVDFEKVLFFLFLIAFSIMLLAQALMLDPSTRASIVSGIETEGLPLGEEEYLYNEGTVTLMLTSSVYQPDMKILVNGVEVGSFSSQKVNVTVKDGDVIEIDGNEVADEQTVEVVSQSDNIISQHIGEMVSVKSDIKKLLKVKME